MADFERLEAITERLEAKTGANKKKIGGFSQKHSQEEYRFKVTTDSHITSQVYSAKYE
jgi:hypothetical protein